MARPGRTQKQIAERYKGNLGYYRKLHPWRRARLIVSLVVFFGGLIGIWLFYRHGHETFFNAGPISANHAGLADNCAACHDKTLRAGGAITAEKLKAVIRQSFESGITFEAIDRKCESCHQHHTFHEPNVVQNRSCSVCHQEHQGPGPMTAVSSSHCASCHNSSTIMEAAAQKGMQLPPDAFHGRHPHPPQQVVFELPRPPQGFTGVFSSFWEGHPEFQLISGKARDPNYNEKSQRDILRFNHQRHFAPDIPLVNGQKLDCNYCHKTTTDGRFYQRINFAANCQACHSLQFDSKNPELTLPHGNATAVRAFLRTLPTQYADLAVRKGLSKPGEIQSFVTKQMTHLRERVRSGEDFERQVFFTVDPYKPQRGGGPNLRASFYGCAFCHEVKPVANSAPAITKPVFVDRWMIRSDFDHARHTSVKCDACHHAMQSRETVDVLMPARADCVTCHSPQGKVAAECITCHTYHAPPAAGKTVADSHASAPISLKQMMLGDR